MKTATSFLFAALTLASATTFAATQQQIAAIPGCRASQAAYNYCVKVVDPKNGGVNISTIESIEYGGPESSVGCSWDYGFISYKDGGGWQKLIDLKCDDGPVRF